MRSGIKPAESIQCICVHPRANKLLQKTDEYLISLHTSPSDDHMRAEQERIDSTLLDDFMAKGVLKKVDKPKEEERTMAIRDELDNDSDQVADSPW